jgi:hypothetical protein
MSSVVSVRLTPDDPERPLDGHYQDLNYVPWYARAMFKVRMHYLDWIIAKREAEVKVWRNSLDSHFGGLFCHAQTFQREGT